LNLSQGLEFVGEARASTTARLRLAEQCMIQT
jgi:hypothetical protein